MITKLLVFLVSFALAGSNLPSLSPKILANFNEKIVAGDINALQYLIDSNPKLIKSSFAKTYRNGAFIVAVQEGRAPVVELLLRNGNVNAAANNNEAIRIASARGNIDLVQILLDRPEVGINSKALIEASKNGHTEIVRILLAHPKFDPTINVLTAAGAASKLNHGDIVKLFFNDGRFIPSSFQVQTLERAAAFGNVDLVRFLLRYPHFSPLADFIAVKGDLTSIKTLVEAGYIYERDTLDMAVLQARMRWDGPLFKYLESLKEKLKLPEGSMITMTEQCVICMADDNLLDGFLTLCNHQFHAECLQKWIAKKNACPICRSPIL